MSEAKHVMCLPKKDTTNKFVLYTIHMVNKILIYTSIRHNRGFDGSSEKNYIFSSKMKTKVSFFVPQFLPASFLFSSSRLHISMRKSDLLRQGNEETIYLTRA